MIYAVIDTNILVSAMLSKHRDTATVQVLNAIFDGKITPVINPDITKEYFEVLCRPKFSFETNIIKELISAIQHFAISVDRTPYEENMIDEKDRVFYEVTLSKEDAYLVTGNQKHFPQSPIVVTPAEMMDILLQQE